MISYPFAIDSSRAPDAVQLELIDILNDGNLKTAYDQQYPLLQQVQTFYALRNNVKYRIDACCEEE